jgi:hypothetical protein
MDHQLLMKLFLGLLLGVFLLNSCSKKLTLRQAAQIKFKNEYQDIPLDEASSQVNATLEEYQQLQKKMETAPDLKEEFQAHYRLLEMQQQQTVMRKNKWQEKVKLVTGNTHPETKLPLNSIEKEIWLKKLYQDQPKVKEKKLAALKEKQKRLFISGYNPFYLHKKVPLTQEVKPFWKEKLFQDEVVRVEDPGEKLNSWFAQQKQKKEDQKNWAARSIEDIKNENKQKQQQIKAQHELFNKFHYEKLNRHQAKIKNTISDEEYARLMTHIYLMDRPQQVEALKRLRQYQKTSPSNNATTSNKNKPRKSSR